MKKFFYVAFYFLLIILISVACRKSNYSVDEVITITDNGQGIGTTTLKADKEYLIQGLVFVNEGQTLTIEPGTVIKFKPGQAENASALIVCRGAKIIAEGTPSKPIIFTAESDDLEGSIPMESAGFWGGLVILGNAPINALNNESRIEGIPIYDQRTEFGGNDPFDNSGILKYVSIRHGGTSLTEGNEINGLTLGGVGSETIIEYVEVIANNDDGFEFFGGTVNCKYLISAFCSDDAFDFDDGYAGKGQFWLAIQTSFTGDFLLEHDGGYDQYNNSTKPTIANATVIGRGINGNRGTVTFRNGSGGIYKNSIFINQAWGFNIQYENTDYDSYTKFLQNKIKIENNIFYFIGYSNTNPILKLVSETQSVPPEKQNLLNQYFIDAQNKITNPGISIETNTIFVIPQNDISMPQPFPDDDWFQNTNYAGAFKDINWTMGWSYLSKTEYLQ